MYSIADLTLIIFYCISDKEVQKVEDYVFENCSEYKIYQIKTVLETIEVKRKIIKT